VLAGAEAGIWDWDVPGRRVVYSQRWSAMRGFGEDEITESDEEWTNGFTRTTHRA